MIRPLFCCESTVALISLHGLALSFSWPAATGRSRVTCNQCHLKAKMRPYYYYLRLLMRRIRVLTATICHESGTDISFLKKDSPILNHIIHRLLLFFFVLNSEHIFVFILLLLRQCGPTRSIHGPETLTLADQEVDYWSLVILNYLMD